MTNDLASSEVAGTLGERLLVASFRPALPARFVRVSDPAGLSAVEVSAWPPAPPPVAAPLDPARPSAADGGDGGGIGGGSGSDDDLPAVPIGAALVLLGVCGGLLIRSRAAR